MAVVVDISESKHLSYSPLNEKHNVLYNNTRRSFLQRYKQTPWFRLNPFTDRELNKGENLDSYDPAFDGSLAPLQSLVIVEDYFNDTPQFSKEFKISEFWDFLFSDSWSGGYAVRVFEGQLLDLMVTCLLSLTRTGRVINHVTKAFAKNKRQKYSLVKKSKKMETELIPFTETLFLQFIYYGHAVKPAFYDPESSVGYPDITTTTTRSSSCIRETTASLSENGTLVGLPIASSKAPSSASIDSKKPPHSVSIEYQRQHPNQVTHVRASKDAHIQIEKERAIITRFLSHNNESIIPIPPPIPRGKSYRYTCSNFSNASDDYKSLPPRDDLNHFYCTEKVLYLGEFKLPDDEDSESSADEHEAADDYGQEFYLGDTNGRLKENVLETAEKKLQKNKEILRKRREEKNQELSKLKPVRSKVMAEFSELDVSKYFRFKEVEVKNIIGVGRSDRVPTLEEYAEMLEAEQRREARARSKKLTWKKSVTIKPDSEDLEEKSGGTVSELDVGKSDVLKKKVNQAQKKVMLQRLLKAKKIKKMNIEKRTNKIEVPLVYVSTPAGMTFLHPISKEWLMKKRMEEPDIPDFKEKPSLPTPSDLIGDPQTVQQSTAKSLNDGKDKKPVRPSFPKIKLIPSEIESPDESEESEEEESDDLDESLFDAKKLNIRYSRDRIRQVLALKRREEEKQKRKLANFTQVLKKYIRVKTILTALSPSKRQRRTSLAGLGKRKKNTSKHVSEEDTKRGIVESNPFANVGKLKWFSFLEAKDKAQMETAEPAKALFENYPMELFRENLERALKEFVVRREVVVSDYNGKSLVSVTFTKKSVFTKSKYSN